MSTATASIDAQALKTAAQGRWREVLLAAGIPDEFLDGKHHPCPRCGGSDRFRLLDESAGAVICNQCFASKNGDGIAAVQWIRGATFPDALRLIAGYLGVLPLANGKHRDIDIVSEVAISKRMPVDAFKLFGAAAAKRGKLLVARVPVFDGNGEQCTEFDLTADGKGLFKKGGGSGVFLPGRKPAAGETWLIVEGVKDAAALVGLGYNALGMPTCKLRSEYAELLRECRVVLVPDLDTAGQDGAQLTAARLVGIATTVKVARLPGEITASNGADVRDALRQDGGEQLVRDAIEKATTWELPTPDGSDDEQPEVELSYNESRVVADVLPVVGNLGWTFKPQYEELRTYQRSGSLYHVVSDATPLSGIDLPDGQRRIRPLPTSLLRERIASAVRLFIDVTTSDGIERKYQRPPDWLTKMVHERGEYPRNYIRPITGIVSSPTMRLDGSLISQPGYDARTGLLCDISGQWPTIPDQPTIDDAKRSAAELLDVVTDFPFAGAEHRSCWLALVLSLVGRSAIAGPVPLIVVDANTRGSGKSLSADAAGIIATGQRLPRKTWPTDDDEIRKTITAVALEALPVVLLDNIAGQLGSASLDAALTGMSWSDRILGQSRTTGTLPLTTVWCATGNNVELGADTARRTLLLRLESPDEHPEERSGFRHGDLLAWVTAERRRLVTAALTILRGYVAAGRPDQRLTPWGSFEAWSGLVRSAITWCGLPDPAETRQVVRDADRSAELLKMVLTAIEATGDATSAELVRLATAPVGADETDPYPMLRHVVGELCGDRVTPQRLGMHLRRYIGRVCGGRSLAREPGHAGLVRWVVHPCVVGLVGPGGTLQHPLTREIPTIEDGNGKQIRNRPSEVPPAPPVPPPPCNHRDPFAWQHRDGSAYCRGCGKWMGRLRATEA